MSLDATSARAAPSLSAADAQAQLAEEFLAFDDWMDRYQLIIDQGKRLAALPETERTDSLKVPGARARCG